MAVLLAALTCDCGGNAAQRARHEPPTGVVDVPTAGAILRPGPTLVGGWAVDDTGVREIRVYFDGAFKARTILTVARPDVSKAMPRRARPGDIHGWNVLVDFGMAAGNHTIRVEMVAGDGTATSIGVVPVTVPY
jgi:N-acetylmuramoyl-L-alanine amidase